MPRRMQFRRLFWLALLLGVAFAGLGYRLVDLQVVRHDELKSRAQRNTQREFLLEPRRGDILDIKGNILATTTYVKTVWADPSLIVTNQALVARAIAPLLGLSEDRLAQKLAMFRPNSKGETVTNKFVIIAKKVPAETWEKVRQAMTNLTFGVDEKKLKPSELVFYNQLRTKAVNASQQQMRVYPNDRLAVHVIGFTAESEQQVNNTTVTQISGQDGIEKIMETKLAGVRGWRVTETDGKQNEMVALREQNVEPQDGAQVVLTIDSVIQHILESALAGAMERHAPISASGIVIRPRTGEILAMATLPNFSPTVPNELTRNRLVTDEVEPGSTFKIVVVSAALNENAVSLNEVFYCEQGLFHYAGWPLHDHEKYGNLSVQQIITKSSNIGAAKVGLKLGENRLYDYIRQFGFGSRTGIPLQGERTGTVHALDRWKKVSLVQIPMGQGIAVTPLQMTMAMCALANKGLLMRPMLVDRVETREHTLIAKYAPQSVRQVVTEDTARLMVKALKTVVSPEGTAPKAALDHYTAAGKTGTAQKAEKNALGRSVYVRKYFSSFIGFFPADNPELCIGVMLDEPKNGYYGGQAAGPIFKEIAEKAANYLDIPPEDEPDSKPATGIAAAAEKKSSAGVLTP